jgi:probable phosphoglycerate mutase
MIGLVVAEPIGQLIACYLRRDPRVHLEDHVATGGFDAITVSAEALNHGDSP